MSKWASNSQLLLGTSDQLRRAFQIVDQWVIRHPLLTLVSILGSGLLPLIKALSTPQQSDVGIYQSAAEAITNGKIPYEDFLLEYPPYVIPIFLLANIFGPDNYTISFKLLTLACDTLLKCVLLAVGLRAGNGIRSFLPIAIYSFAIPFISHFYLQRYDVFVACVSTIAIVFFSFGRYFLSGVAVAIGVNLKLYPIVFVLPLWSLAKQPRKSKLFLGGVMAGMIPVLLGSFFFPWWRYLSFHTDRGLQADSLVASILWFGKHLAVFDVTWEGGKRCMEVHGGIVERLLPYVRIQFAFAVAITVLLATVRATRQSGRSPEQLCILLLAPLLAFVGFNFVFTPQFTIWILPLAAISSLNKDLRIAGWSLFAIGLTFCFYPSEEYEHSGLNLSQTLALLCRNLVFIGMWMKILGSWLKKSE